VTDWATVISHAEVQKSLPVMLKMELLYFFFRMIEYLRGGPQSSSPCTATFNDLLCFIFYFISVSVYMSVNAIVMFKLSALNVLI
jgi:hypothetical protein